MSGEDNREAAVNVNDDAAKEEERRKKNLLEFKQKLREFQRRQLNLAQMFSQTVTGDDMLQGFVSEMGRRYAIDGELLGSLIENVERQEEMINSGVASKFGLIEITSVCASGQFVTIFNKGTEDYPMSGHRLVRTIDGIRVTEYDFPNSIILKAGKYLTVWSSTSSRLMNEPDIEEIVMDNQSWSVGDEMTTSLFYQEQILCSLLSPPE